ncbi:MAG: hypothetical protein U0271_38330 [Polyangiaceae bacterium]
MSELAAAARRLSCEPALFYLSEADLRKELSLPKELELQMGGPSSVSIKFPKGGKATELAAALGVPNAVASRRNAGAWGWKIWDLVTETKANKLELWGPGVLNIGVDVDDAGLDDKVDSVALEQAKLDGYLSVTMPESVLPLEDDAVALQMLLAGLAQLATDKKRVSDEPEATAKWLRLEDPRFRLSRRSSGTGASAIHGTDLWTARTIIAAGPVIEALGLSGKIEHNHAYDSDDYLLYDGERSEFTWRELKLELSFDQRRGEPAPGPYGGYVLSGITLMP